MCWHSIRLRDGTIAFYVQEKFNRFFFFFFVQIKVAGIVDEGQRYGRDVHRTPFNISYQFHL